MTSQSSSEKGIGNLKKKSIFELRELLSRQVKLLQNKSFVNKLPDKGNKILKLKINLEEELNRRNSVDAASSLLAQLDLNGIPEEIEWSGKYKTAKRSNDLDSDDDSDDNVDPLKLIATHSGTQTGVKSKTEKEVYSLVTPSDVEQFKPIKYAQELCKKYGSASAPERFKPSHPKAKEEEVKTGFRSSSENVRSKLGRHWEVTAATPPVPLHGDTKMISLVDSLSIQTKHAQRLKEIQLEEAMTRLRQPSGFKMGNGLPTTNLMKYRTPDPTALFEGSPQRERDEQDEGLLDEEKGGAVFYNLIDDVPDTGPKS